MHQNSDGHIVSNFTLIIQENQRTDFKRGKMYYTDGNSMKYACPLHELRNETTYIPVLFNNHIISYGGQSNKNTLMLS
jgi:hypothetical protein